MGKAFGRFAPWLMVLALPAALAPQENIEILHVDAREPGRAFPHFWEQMFGSGRAILSLRESYRRDLRSVKGITEFEYVRFHAIFHDETGVYANPYNFSYVDQIYDGLLENGVRPFVELSFMPSKLAASQTPHAFWYKPLPSPPQDYSKWADLVYNFTRHLVERYGVEEVSHWYFEVWNEPNIDFWTGQPKEATYYELYDSAARAVKRVSSRLRVGGPATAQAAWVDRFIRHCVERNAPADFVSTHVYANDLAQDVFGTSESIPRSDMVARSVKKVFDQVKNSARPELPILWSEYNASYKNEVDVTDSAYMGPWLANNIALCDGMTAMMSYWTFSDVFEEQGIVKTPFYGGFGLIAAGGIPKAAYNAFALLHQLGDRRLEMKEPGALATRRADGSLAIAVWNYAPPGGTAASRRIRVDARNTAGAPHYRVRIVDGQHGSALETWASMGAPSFPTREQQEKLRASAKNLAESNGPEFTLAPHGLALVEVGR